MSVQLSSSLPSAASALSDQATRLKRQQPIKVGPETPPSGSTRTPAIIIKVGPNKIMPPTGTDLPPRALPETSATSSTTRNSRAGGLLNLVA